MSFIAEVEGHLAGFILARLEYQGFPIDEVAVIHSMAVAPKLIDKLHNECKAKGIPTIRILIPKNDTELVKLFEHLGFSLSSYLNFDKPC